MPEGEPSREALERKGSVTKGILKAPRAISKSREEASTMMTSYPSAKTIEFDKSTKP